METTSKECPISSPFPTTLQIPFAQGYQVVNPKITYLTRSLRDICHIWSLPSWNVSLGSWYFTSRCSPYLTSYSSQSLWYFSKSGNVSGPFSLLYLYTFPSRTMTCYIHYLLNHYLQFWLLTVLDVYIQLDTSLSSHRHLKHNMAERTRCPPCIIRSKISSAALTSLSLTGPQKDSCELPCSCQKCSYPVGNFPVWLFPLSPGRTAPTPKPFLNLTDIAPCQPIKLFKQANQNFLQEPIGTAPSCYYKACFPTAPLVHPVSKCNTCMAYHSMQCPLPLGWEYMTNKPLFISSIQYQVLGVWPSAIF